MFEQLHDSSADGRSSQQRRVERVDLVVVGGGLAGLTLAIAVAGAGLRVVVIERGSLEATTAPGFDGRVTAVAPASRRLLDSIGAWAAMASEAQPILDIAVMEGVAPAAVHYDHRALGREPLGHIVENRTIREGLLARARAIDTLELVAPATVVDVVRTGEGAFVTLACGRVVETALVAACDGRESRLRKEAGIGVTRWSYRQTGIVCTLAHARPHRGVAIERFFPDGPFARLPMTGNRCSIVWALDEDRAAAVTALPNDAFLGEVAARFGDDLGVLTLEGPRFSYPLALVWARRFAALRLALVGDAARAIHPIAGQGWNLGLRDVATLAEILVDAHRLGQDIGGATALARYERWRRFDSLTLVAVTDGINRLFANDVWPLRLARGLGLGLVEQMPGLKRLFMRHAMGELGDLPRPLRGEAL